MRQNPLARLRAFSTLMRGGYLLLSACAGIAGAPSPNQRSTDRVITRDEIPYAQAKTAHDVVERLRPKFLVSARDPSFATERLVYVNGIRAGGLDQLYNIPASAIREIRLLTAGEATSLLGPGHSGGVLLITLTRGLLTSGPLP